MEWNYEMKFFLIVSTLVFLSTSISPSYANGCDGATLYSRFDYCGVSCTVVVAKSLPGDRHLKQVFLARVGLGA